MLDYDRKIENLGATESMLFIILQSFCTIIIQVLINFVSQLKMIIIPSILVCVINMIGIFKMSGGGNSAYEVLIEQKQLLTFLLYLLFLVVGIFYNHQILSFTGKEIMKAWQITNKLQSEVVNILEMFGEAIICKNGEGLGFCN